MYQWELMIFFFKFTPKYRFLQNKFGEHKNAIAES